MDINRLIHMTNQIAANIAPGQPEENAVMAITLHLQRFWDPRMRNELLDFVEQTGGTGLDPIALKAVKSLKHTIKH